MSESQVGWASQMALVAENLPAAQETWVQSLGQEDPLEEGRATHSSILAWRIPWTAEPRGLQSMGPPTESRSTHQAGGWLLTLGG